MSSSSDPKSVPVFILAGGLGSRISEETNLRPKPMIEIGGTPIIVHIMNWYYSFGFRDFVICAGYKSWDIKEYFLNYYYRVHGLVVDNTNILDVSVKPFGESIEVRKWKVTVVDTGLHTLTGGRIAKAFDMYSKTEDFSNFAVTYGDGVCNVDLQKELEFHKSHKKIGTVLGVNPIARFGELKLNQDQVQRFSEKTDSTGGLINGGFFLFKRQFRQYLQDSTDCCLERQPLESLANDGELKAFKHLGFWHCMDTLRDKNRLQEIWDSGSAPWATSQQEKKKIDLAS